MYIAFVLPRGGMFFNPGLQGDYPRPLTKNHLCP